MISTVFVCESWGALRALLGPRPAQSRAGAPLWVGDVDDKEAARFLAHLGVEADVAQVCVGLVGGALLLLERAAGLYFAGASVGAIRAKLMDLMAVDFELAGVPEGGGEAEHAQKVGAVTALLRSGSQALSAAEWRERVPDAGRREQLLDSGILNFDGQRVVFASRLARLYAEEVLQAKHAAAKRK